MHVTIRPAQPSDAEVLLDLIKELAEYEKLSAAVVATPEKLRQTLFGNTPWAKAVIARLDEEPIGFALYFYNYSTFLAKPGVYLEDLFVRPQHRGRGVGKSLFTRVAREAIRIGAGRLEWAVLDWNQAAIKFYKRIGAEAMDEWTVFRLTGEQLRLASESS